jgi:hypothetical protein
VSVCVIRVTRVCTNTSKGMATNSKLKRLNRDNIVELILYPDSDYVVSVGLGNGQKKLFFHLLDMTILNSFLLLTAYGTKITCRDFRLSLVRNLTERAGSLPRPCRLLGRPCVSQKHVTRLEVNFSSRWLFPSSRLYCRACSA